MHPSILDSEKQLQTTQRNGKSDDYFPIYHAYPVYTFQEISRYK
jgi:hypothetical protein